MMFGSFRQDTKCLNLPRLAQLYQQRPLGALLLDAALGGNTRCRYRQPWRPTSAPWLWHARGLPTPNHLTVSPLSGGSCRSNCSSCYASSSWYPLPQVLGIPTLQALPVQHLLL